MWGSRMVTSAVTIPRGKAPSDPKVNRKLTLNTGPPHSPRSKVADDVIGRMGRNNRAAPFGTAEPL
jgi:hypothetical protein